MNDDKIETVDVDSAIFSNPFDRIDYTPVQRMILYRNYFNNKSNQKNLQLIGNKKIISTEENPIWTRAEILASLACKNGYRKSLTVVNRDITTNLYGIIVHQVNCQGVMGSGLAKTIRTKWPVVFETYKKIQKMTPGIIQMVKVSEPTEKYPLFVCNLFGQNEYGNSGLFTDYFNVRSALKKLMKIRAIKQMSELPVYFPFLMGCNRGGGDWNKYSKFIQKYHPDAIICKL